jgi:hypothetical protein
MTIYQPTTPYSDSIMRPVCRECGRKMMLSRIEPDAPGHDKRTFECAVGHEHSEIVKFK